MARRRLGFWRRFAVSTVKPLMTVLTRRTWSGMENIPKTGPVIIVANHISHADPFVLAHFVYDAGRWPRFLAKDSIFRIPVLGRLVRYVQQIPVARGSVDAVRALDEAVAGVEQGGAILVYPEGTTTKQPQLWPMRGKTGAARLWLASGAPVVPVAMWGPERIFDPRTRKLRLRLRTPVSVTAGPTLDLSRWQGSAATAPVLAEITEAMMLALRDMLAQLRGEPAPPLWGRPTPTAATTAPTTPPDEAAVASDETSTGPASAARVEG